MCLIAFGPLPEEDILEKASIENPDGIGVSWVESDGIHYRKGLTVPALLRLPASVRAKCAVHFRLATAGGDVPQLIHPFPVERAVPLAFSGVADRVLMHNGHVFGWEKLSRKKLKGPVSDSRLLASMVSRYGVDVLSAIPNQRILLMSRKKTTLLGDWVRDGERWYSNSSFKEKRISYAYSYYGSDGLLLNQNGWGRKDRWGREDRAVSESRDITRWKGHYREEAIEEKRATDAAFLAYARSRQSDNEEEDTSAADLAQVTQVGACID